MNYQIVLLAVILISIRFTSSLPVSTISPVNQFPQGYNGGSSRKSTNPFTSDARNKPVAGGFAHPKISEVLARNEKEKEENRKREIREKREQAASRSHSSGYSYGPSYLDTTCFGCPPIYFPDISISNTGSGSSSSGGGDVISSLTNGSGGGGGSGLLDGLASSGGGGGGWFDGFDLGGIFD